MATLSEIALTSSTTGAVSSDPPELSKRESGKFRIAKVYGVVPTSGIDKEIYDALEAADKDGDGVISMDELKGIIHSLVGERKTSAQYKKWFCVASWVALFFLLAIFGLSALSAYAFTKVDTDSRGNVTAKDDNPCHACAQENSCHACIHKNIAACIHDAGCENACVS